jgi:hypothetical protein
LKLERKKILVLVLVLLVGFLLGRMTYSPYSFGGVDWKSECEYYMQRAESYTLLSIDLERAYSEIEKLKEEK